MLNVILVTMLAFMSAGQKSSTSTSAKSEHLKDVRDGKTYKTIKIGEQTWMAQNLDFVSDSSWCYAGDSANCQKYGRLYNWDAASSACPEGWHLPSATEWGSLVDVAGSRPFGKLFKSKKGWKRGQLMTYAIDLDGGGMRSVKGPTVNGNGIDAYGFGALPAGSRSNGIFINVGFESVFWSATVDEEGLVLVHVLKSNSIDRLYGHYSRQDGQSVRCIKGAEHANAQ